MNQLMIRIFSANENQESAVLDQIQSDIELTKELGPQVTEQYTTKLDEDGNVLIHDTVNNELTKAIDNNGEILLEDMGKFKMSDSTKQFANTKRRKFVVDKQGNLVAYGWDTNLGRLLKDNPDLTLVDHYDLKQYVESENKKFSNFSEEHQKLFTRNNNQWAVLDQSDKLVLIGDIWIAKNLVKDHDGYKMIRKRDYMKSQQEKLVNFSDTNVDRILNSLN